MLEIVPSGRQTSGHVLTNRINIDNWPYRHEPSVRGMTFKFLSARYTANPKQIHALQISENWTLLYTFKLNAVDMLTLPMFHRGSQRNKSCW